MQASVRKERREVALHQAEQASAERGHRTLQRRWPKDGVGTLALIRPLFAAVVVGLP